MFVIIILIETILKILWLIKILKYMNLTIFFKNFRFLFIFESKLVIIQLVNYLFFWEKAAQKEAEAQNGNIVFLNARARRISNSTVLGLLFAALIVVSIGIVGGLYFHQKFIPRYRGSIRISPQK